MNSAADMAQTPCASSASVGPQDNGSSDGTGDSEAARSGAERSELTPPAEPPEGSLTHEVVKRAAAITAR